MGGALNLGGVAAIFGCSFTAKMAFNSGLAVATVGSLEIHHSSFQGNALFCDEGEFLDERLQVYNPTLSSRRTRSSGLSNSVSTLSMFEMHVHT